MEYYITLKLTRSSAIVTHKCNDARAKQLIDDWRTAFHQYEIFQVLKQ